MNYKCLKWRFDFFSPRCENSVNYQPDATSMISEAHRLFTVFSVVPSQTTAKLG